MDHHRGAGLLPTAARLGSDFDSEARVRILHLTDTHVSGPEGPDGEGIDGRAVLDGLLFDCRHLEDLDLVVVSGDVADDGSRQGYRAVRERVGAFARARGAATAYAVGNHDLRDAFEAELGSGHFDRNGRSAGRPLVADHAVRAAVSMVAGHRIITLDSLVPGAVEGLVSPEQLDALAVELAASAERGSVIVLHHPPVTLDLPLQQKVGLQNADALAETIRGSDVQVVLCGHFHLQLSGILAGIPVVVGPGIISRVDLTAPSRLERAVRGAQATVVDLGGPMSPRTHLLQARDPRAGEAVYLVEAVSGVDVPDED